MRRRMGAGWGRNRVTCLPRAISCFKVASEKPSIFRNRTASFEFGCPALLYPRRMCATSCRCSPNSPRASAKNDILAISSHVNSFTGRMTFILLSSISFGGSAELISLKKAAPNSFCRFGFRAIKLAKSTRVRLGAKGLHKAIASSERPSTASCLLTPVTFFPTRQSRNDCIWSRVGISGRNPLSDRKSPKDDTKSHTRMTSSSYALAMVGNARSDWLSINMMLSFFSFCDSKTACPETNSAAFLRRANSLPRFLAIVAMTFSRCTETSLYKRSSTCILSLARRSFARACFFWSSSSIFWRFFSSRSSSLCRFFSSFARSSPSLTAAILASFWFLKRSFDSTSSFLFASSTRARFIPAIFSVPLPRCA